MSVQPIRTPNPLDLLAGAPRTGPQAGAGFGSVLHDAVSKVEAFHAGASKKVENFLSGENEDLHTTILAVQRAELAFELFQQVRNKIAQAYQEVMRMQV